MPHGPKTDWFKKEYKRDYWNYELKSHEYPRLPIASRENVARLRCWHRQRMADQAELKLLNTPDQLFPSTENQRQLKFFVAKVSRGITGFSHNEQWDAVTGNALTNQGRHLEWKQCSIYGGTDRIGNLRDLYYALCDDINIVRPSHYDQALENCDNINRARRARGQRGELQANCSRAAFIDACRDDTWNRNGDWWPRDECNSAGRSKSPA